MRFDRCFLAMLSLVAFSLSVPVGAELIEVVDQPRVLDLAAVDAVVIPEGAHSRVFVRADEGSGSPVLVEAELVEAELVEAELVEHLTEAGVEAESRDPRGWGRPWVEVVAGVGLPNLLNGRVEVRVTDQWTVGLGGGIGLLPAAGEATARFTPGWACWGCNRRVQASVSFGPDLILMPDRGRVAVLLAGAVEAEVVAWLAQGFGLTLGTRWGLGVTRDFGPEQYSMRVEPALNIVLLQLGAVFGERRN